MGRMARLIPTGQILSSFSATRRAAVPHHSPPLYLCQLPQLWLQRRHGVSATQGGGGGGTAGAKSLSTAKGQVGNG